MDLTQRRLTRGEWESIEVPSTNEEKRVGRLLLEGAKNPTVRRNRAISLASYLQIDRTPATSAHFWTAYLYPELSKGHKNLRDCAPTKMGFGAPSRKTKAPSLRSADRIRLRNADKTLKGDEKRIQIFEFVLIDLIKEIFWARKHGKDKAQWLRPYYALRTLRNRAVAGLHETLSESIETLVNTLDKEVNVEDLILGAGTIMERNDHLLRHADDQLFEHQRLLLEACADRSPRLILLTAPTGTGKTVSPVGVSEIRKVVFVCAARHVGLALAKLAVSLEKKVAFAFGCTTAEDIRLHYYSATDCIRDRRSGRIVKVDNSAGESVEIMICDVRSCTVASEYMLQFNTPESLVLYWDEPTIALDYKEHPCHSIIQQVWSENRIPTIVMSSATLPSPQELEPTINDFRDKFPGAGVLPIASHECRKSIPLHGRNGELIMPHDLGRKGCCGSSGAATEAGSAASHCLSHKTLLRHLDLDQASKFIAVLLDEAPEFRERLLAHFPTVDSVTTESAKCFYLRCVQETSEIPELFQKVLISLGASPRQSTARVMTSDAHTITDGPAIFLAEDVNTIARFCIQDAALPADVLVRLGKSIAHNSELRRRLDVMQMEYENGTQKDQGKGREKKLASERVDPAMKKIAKNMDALRAMIKPAAVLPEFVPNTVEHKKKHAPGKKAPTAFAPEISEQAVEEAMMVEGVDDKWKLLLLLGVGVFAPWNSASYTELMKKLAHSQKLYMVVATSDYIYGTNYQFCHGYIGKDLGEMSQEKCIQAMGRVGRNRLQQTYSIRFRDDGLIRRLFREEVDRPEVENMGRLFVRKIA